MAEERRYDLVVFGADRRGCCCSHQLLWGRGW